MKRICFISALLLVCGFAWSKPVHSYVLHAAGIETHATFLKEKAHKHYLKNEDFDPGKSSENAKKRKRPKGTEVGMFLVNDCHSDISLIENDLIFSLQASCYSRFYSSNGKRGPPLVI